MRNRRRTVMAAAALFLMSVAAIGDEPKFNTDGVLSLMGRFSIGHACPVEPGFAITAAHVLDKVWFDSEVDLLPFRFENGAGEEGLALPSGVLMEADLGWVFLFPPVTVYYPFAKERPKRGDKIYWIEYETKDQDKVFQSRIRESEIITVRAGHIFTKRTIRHGASGGCAWNEAGEVIGISVKSFRFGYSGDAGGFVGVWGKWSPKKPEPKPAEEPEEEDGDTDLDA